MTDDVYRKLARVLDTLPNGFPATRTGVELALLERIFEPAEAALFCELRLTPETPAEIAGRTGRAEAELAAELAAMTAKGLILSEPDGVGGVVRYRMVPWVMGIFEFQLHRMDPELARLFDTYEKVWGLSFVAHGPPLFQVIPPLQVTQPLEALPYERVAEILDQGQSFLVTDCVCRTKKRLLGEGCDKPLETCLGIGLTPDAWDNHPTGRVISREEAFDIMRAADEAGLVHNTHNFELGHRHICNCCGCCCGLIGAVRRYGIARQACNSYYWADIDNDLCVDCGLCENDRCQTDAIVEYAGKREVIRGRCIGCGLCVTSCPAEAITLVRKPAEELVPPPKDEQAWMEARGQARGVDYSKLK